MQLQCHARAALALMHHHQLWKSLQRGRFRLREDRDARTLFSPVATSTHEDLGLTGSAGIRPCLPACPESSMFTYQVLRTDYGVRSTDTSTLLASHVGQDAVL